MIQCEICRGERIIRVPIRSLAARAMDIGEAMAAEREKWNARSSG